MEVIWAAAIAATGTLIGVWLGDYLQTKAGITQAKATALQSHNDQAAAAIAQLSIMTDKMRPDSFIWEPEHGASLQRIDGIIEELRDQQMALTTVSIGHPIKEIREGMAKVRKLSVTVLQNTRAFVETFSGLEEGQMHGDVSGTRDAAIGSWTALRDVIQLLVDKMHEETEA